MSIKVHSVNPEIISTNDFQPTISPFVFVDEEGSVVFFLEGDDSATLVRPIIETELVKIKRNIFVDGVLSTEERYFDAEL